MIVADRFRLERPLGVGGMGTVWLAHQTALDVPCAVKFIHAEAASSPEIRARFEREAKSAAQLRSPNVVQILDHGVWQGSPYIAMEYLEGEDLAGRLRRMGKLSPAETASIASQVARALTRAHAAGLVHRDLKPANIFLVRDDDREIAKILDFGVVKSTASTFGVGDANTKTGSAIGTPFYMSPEQAQGTKLVDHRSDLWALGVVVFRCITGHLPFQSQALGDLFMKIMVLPIPVPSQIAPVPPGFDAWWARAAARDPEQRFQSAKELAEALGWALGLGSPGAGEIVGAQSFGRESMAAIGAPTPTPALQGQGVETPVVWPAAAVPNAASWSDAQTSPMPQTAAPVVAASSQAAKPARSSAAFLVAGLAGLAAFVAALAVFLVVQKPSAPAASAPTAAPTPSALLGAPSSSAPAIDPAPPPPVVSASPPATSKPAVVPAPSASIQAPVVKAPPPPPKPAPTSKPSSPKRPDFGI
jgi:Protein kinase domain